ncbi:alanine--tRNA ligase, cytoplasmic-like [Lingula anatina]|uniref:Alanine--tRNA ligase n=1 Tax=Lingula anatina TaxID=7574 RepID=A0A1S3KB54_LINAN|nr:alanine--tRNA ligase, cytoplasmic-like [Lingula anatina]|eukprot:XP_013419865.1 alanine--tRNA ligase, cytoplasmic-like [Lingula anatina]
MAAVGRAGSFITLHTEPGVSWCRRRHAWHLLSKHAPALARSCFNCGHHIHTTAVVSSQDSAQRLQWPARRVRQEFLDFFTKVHGHQFVPSSSIVPKKGEGTYFVNAGMNQFKPVFLGTVPANSEMANYRRVVNSQKCVRVGGKHNDLDDVGKDLYHHTFFEMLGNWSFADYFKEEACKMAWQLLTEVYNISQERLYVTYFGGNEQLGLDPDLETREIWLKLGIPEDHLFPSGMKDNFWDMGETGPCGPCTEIHYDHVGGQNAGHLVNMDSPEVVEIWNLVFMQYDRQPDGSLVPLPRQHVDTGLGLERMTAVMQGKMSNYDTDLFQPLFSAIQKSCNSPVYQGRTGASDEAGVDTAYRIIGDHTRMFTVALSDGLVPGRGNMEFRLRTIMHRCMRQASEVLKAPEGMLGNLVEVVVESLGDTFPELGQNCEQVKNVVNATEQRYLQQTRVGRKAVNKFLRQVGNVSHVTAEQMLKLHEGRYGHPLSVDLLMDMGEERGISMDWTGFERKLQDIKERSTLQPMERDPVITLNSILLQKLISANIRPTEDSYKYDYVSGEEYVFAPLQCQIAGILVDGELVSSIEMGQQCGILLDKTCFYAEGGGQAADRGTIVTEDSVFSVEDVQSVKDYVVHMGVVAKGRVTVGSQAEAKIAEDYRQGCMRNHTATHLLNYALNKVLGDVKQKGSSVTPDKLTFDFTCLGKVSSEQILQVEKIVNKFTSSSWKVYREEVPLVRAKEINGLVSLENEVYPNSVYVVSVGTKVMELPTSEASTGPVETSVELCGGTHVHNTSHIGPVVIVNMSGHLQGVKRISAVTGPQAEQAIELSKIVKEQVETVVKAIKNLENPETWEENLREISQV